MLKFFVCVGLGSASILVSAAPNPRAKFDAPDLSFEQELHRQYLRAHGRISGISTLAKDAYVEDYQIQSGETLWSMSRVLYGDGSYWPRVWAQNSAITNPHLIRRGHALQFLMGSEDDTPAFRFTEAGGDGVELAAASGGGGGIEIPPPEIPPRPVLSVPSSFPEWQSVYKRQPKPIIDDRGLNRKRDAIADRIFLRAWVEEKEFKPIGFYLENDTEAGLPVVNQYVFIKMKKGMGHVGQKLLIAHTAGEIRTVQDEFDIDDPAFLLQVAGELQITEEVDHSYLKHIDPEDFDCYRALVTKTTGLSMTGNALIPGELPFVNLDPNGPHGSATAHVLGAEHHAASMLFGQGDIVFLDKGQTSGVEAGQIYELYANRRLRRQDTPVVFSPAPSGRLKIVKSSSRLSTALVLSAHDSIMQGDEVRPVSGRHDEVERKTPPHLPPIWSGMILDSNPATPMFGNSK